MSETPGPRAMSPSIEERTLGHGPVVEDRVHVTHEQHVRSPRAPEVPITRSPSVGSPACGRRSTSHP